MTRELQIAWAAGFIDGDGCIGFRRYTKNGRQVVRPYIEAAQAATSEPLDRLRELFSGCMSRKGRRTGSGKIVYVWRVTDRPALAAIGEIAPHLIVKRRTAEDVTAYFEREKVYECRHGASPSYCPDCKREAALRTPPEIRSAHARHAAKARWAARDVTVPIPLGG